MQTVFSLDTIPLLPKPIALTIGSFDGLHRGHAALLKKLKEAAGFGTAAVISFSNHPKQILSPHNAPRLICTPEQKLELLQNCGIDLTIILPFDQKLSITPYTDFLKSVHEMLPFSRLVLGKGATLGKDKEGAEAQIKAYGAKLHFTVNYIDKIDFVSSSGIRLALQEGQITQAEEMLGRPI